MSAIKRTVQVVTAPICQPVSLAEAKGWLRIEESDTAHDSVITNLIKAITKRAENLTLRAFIPRRLKLYLSNYTTVPEWGVGIELPWAPLIEVESLKYVDEDGTLQTMDPSLYDVYSHLEPALILPAYLETWPAIRLQPDSLQVTYRAGYTASPEAEADLQAVQPAQLKLWIEANLATLFENREQLIVGTIVQEVARSFGDALLDDLVLADRFFGC